MADTFENTRTELHSPGNDAFVITPSNSTVFADPPRALYIGGVGDVNLVTMNGNTVLFSALPAGTILPMRCTQVLSTDTTATLIVGMY